MRIVEMYVPLSVAARRTSPGTNPVKYVTVHQTGNTAVGADADAHGRLQYRGGTNASWHETVDDGKAVLSYRQSAKCWHAGDGGGSGNMESYAIELCVNSDGDYGQTIRNGAKRAAYRLHVNNLHISRLVQHNKWSGKNCPTQLRAGKAGISWSDFVRMVEQELRTLNNDTKDWFEMATEQDLINALEKWAGSDKGKAQICDAVWETDRLKAPTDTSDTNPEWTARGWLGSIRHNVLKNGS